MQRGCHAPENLGRGERSKLRTVPLGSLLERWERAPLPALKLPYWGCRLTVTSITGWKAHFDGDTAVFITCESLLQDCLRLQRELFVCRKAWKTIRPVSEGSGWMQRAAPFERLCRRTFRKCRDFLGWKVRLGIGPLTLGTAYCCCVGVKVSWANQLDGLEWVSCQLGQLSGHESAAESARPVKKSTYSRGLAENT